MSSQLAENEIKEIAKELVEELRDREDGERITTALLLKESGFCQEYDPLDLIRIHETLVEASNNAGITLDMSEHENKMEGLSYNLDFIIHNIDAQYKCPHCGSTYTARYIYGFVGLDGIVKKKVASGKWILGGCVIAGSQDFNKRHCKSCGKDFFIS
mgnify:CR=1 FL=1